MSLVSGAAYANFVISLKEIPEWAPGYPLEVSHVIADHRGVGSVVITNEHITPPEVSQIALFRYNPDDFINSVDVYQKYRDFYGTDENSDGRLVEGNPKTIVISFYNNGQVVKSIRFSGAVTHSGISDKQTQLPVPLIELRNTLLTYAKQAEPQTKASYYASATPYSENQKYWLLKSAKLETIPVISELVDEEVDEDGDTEFLAKLIQSAPTFLPLQEEDFLRLKQKIGLSGNRFKGVFRVSDGSDALIDIKFMRSIPR